MSFLHPTSQHIKQAVSLLFISLLSTSASMASAATLPSALVPQYSSIQSLQKSEFVELQLADQNIGRAQFGKAIAQLEQTAEKAPTNLLILYNLGHCYFEEGKRQTDPSKRLETLEKAKAVYLRIQTLNDDLTMPYFKLGRIAMLEGKPEEAEAFYKAGLERSPEQASLLFNLATLYDEGNQTDKAMDYYQKTLAADPDFIFAYNNLGLLLEKRNKPQEAEKTYLEALRRDSHYAYAKLNLGNLYAEQGKYQAAEKLFQDVAQQDGQNAWAHLYLANVFFMTDRFEQAAREYRSTISLKSDLSMAYYLLAITLFKLNQYDEAMRIGLKYISLSPNGEFAGEMKNLILALRVQRGADILK